MIAAYGPAEAGGLVENCLEIWRSEHDGRIDRLSGPDHRRGERIQEGDFYVVEPGVVYPQKSATRHRDRGDSTGLFCVDFKPDLISLGPEVGEKSAVKLRDF